MPVPSGSLSLSADLSIERSEREAKPLEAMAANRVPPIHRVAIITLFAGAACIGLAPLLVRLSSVGPSATAFYRVLLALPFLWMWMRRQSPDGIAPIRSATLKDFPKLALAGLLFVADLAIWHWSLQMTTVAKSTLLTNSAPIFVTLGAWLIFGERLIWRFVIALVLAIAGAFLLVGGPQLTWDRDHLRGDLLALLAAVFYAAYLLAVKVLRREFTGPTILAWSGLVSCPGFLLVGWAMGETLWPPTGLSWLVLVALAWISHIGGQTLITTALGHLPASYSSVGLLLQPVIATVLAWFLFDESLGAFQLAGGAVILVGIALAGQYSRGPASEP